LDRFERPVIPRILECAEHRGIKEPACPCRALQRFSEDLAEELADTHALACSCVHPAQLAIWQEAATASLNLQEELPGFPEVLASCGWIVGNNPGTHLTAHGTKLDGVNPGGHGLSGGARAGDWAHNLSWQGWLPPC